MLRSVLSTIGQKCVNLGFKTKSCLRLKGTAYLDALYPLVPLPQGIPDVDHILPGATCIALKHGGVGGVGDAVEQ